MSFEPHEYLRHILTEARYLERLSASVTREDFLADETLQRAFVRSLDIIGEATKQIDRDFRVRHPDIEWRAMAGMRDRLIHEYFGVDLELVWDVVASEDSDRAITSRRTSRRRALAPNTHVRRIP